MGRGALTGHLKSDEVPSPFSLTFSNPVQSGILDVLIIFFLSQLCCSQIHVPTSLHTDCRLLCGLEGESVLICVNDIIPLLFFGQYFFIWGLRDLRFFLGDPRILYKNFLNVCFHFNGNKK